MIRNFDEAIEAALASTVPQRLVLLFVRAIPAPAGAAYHYAGAQLETAMVVDQVLSPRLRLTPLVAAADARDQSWDFVLVCALGGRDGRLPEAEHAHAHVAERFSAALETGDLSRFLMFDREGRRLNLQPERRLH